MNPQQFESIENFYNYIQQDFEDHFYSSSLAQSHYESTGDINVPMTFTVADVEGILPKRVTGQTLLRVKECVGFLRAINAPFTTDPSDHVSSDMETFLEKYLSVVMNQPQDNPEHKMLYQLVRGMTEMAQSKEIGNPFEFYFQKMVPYVQKCVHQWERLPANPPEENLAKEVLIQLQRSSMIRKTFGHFATGFDLIHVMVGCYLCSSDIEMVGNWVLDFMARICQGRYFKSIPNPFDEAMLHCIKSKITYKTNTELHHVVRAIEKGEVSDDLSSLWPNYIKLYQFITRNFTLPNVSQDMVEVALEQTFPKVLFQENSDYLGFLMAQAQVIIACSKKTGMVAKGGFKTARKVYEVLRKAVESVKAFDEIPTIWTMDTLRIFLLSQQDLEKDILNVAKLLFTEEEED